MVDWREGGRPNEPTKLRPAVVIEDSEAFPDDYPNIIVVPLTSDEQLAHAAFSEPIPPSRENGVREPSWALAHHITSVSLRRVTPTSSRITGRQLASLRTRAAAATGVSG